MWYGLKVELFGTISYRTFGAKTTLCMTVLKVKQGVGSIMLWSCFSLAGNLSVSGVDRTRNISTTSHKKPFKFLADSWIKGCAHLCNQLIMLICFFNWIVQVIGHIKGTKSWELFIVVLIFISQMLGILTRVSMLFISTVLNNKYSLSFNSYSIIGHENFMQPCYTLSWDVKKNKKNVVENCKTGKNSGSSI